MTANARHLNLRLVRRRSVEERTRSVTSPRLIDKASKRIGKQMNVVEQHKEIMISAGIKHVVDNVYKVYL